MLLFVRLDSTDRCKFTHGELRQRLLHLLNTQCQHVSSVTLTELNTSADLCDAEPNLWKDMIHDLHSDVRRYSEASLYDYN